MSVTPRIGYAERDPVLGDDSFKTFEEILQMAQELEVDCVLHAGDLFHKNKPSRKTMVRTIQLLRRYTLGDRAFLLELCTSDPRPDAEAPLFSWLSPDISSCMPVIGIHGNHDDRSGDGTLSAVDMLSQAGLFNYIGKSSSTDDIDVNPVILRKGSTQVAIYGLGHMRDEHLHRKMLEKRVKWLQPPDEDYSAFNVALVHQNRVAHTAKGYLDPQQLPEFLDLIVWGHEHDCQVSATKIPGKKSYITQPGSSVATSLMKGESKPKHVALLEVHGEEFRLEALPLTTVRPLIVRDVSLSEANLAVGDVDAIDAFLKKTVEALLVEAREESEVDMLPLMRLRVNLSGGYERISSQRFGLAFVDKVANPSNILTFTKAGKKASSRTASDLLAAADVSASNSRLTVETEVTRILLENRDLSALPVEEMAEALRGFVEKGDKGSLKSTLDRITKQVRKHVLAKAKEAEIHDLDNDCVDQYALEWLSEQNATGAHEQQQDLDALLEGDDEDEDNEEDEPEEEDEEEEEREIKPAKRRAAAPARRTSTRRKKKSKQLELHEEEEEDEEEEEEEEAYVPVKRERRTSRRKTKSINYDEEEEQEWQESEEAPKPKVTKKRATSRRAAKRRTIDLEGDSDFGALVRNRKKK